MRTDCMTEEVLMDYLENRLNENRRKWVERHLAGCAACLEAVAIAGPMIRRGDLPELDPVPETVTERAVKTVKALSRNGWSDKVFGYVHLLVSDWTRRLNEFGPWRPPGLAPVRGTKRVLGEDLILLRKSFSDLDAEIEIEKKAGGKASIRVVLSRDSTPRKPIRVSLLKNGREISSYLLSGAAAMFEDLPFGRFMLVFTRNGTRVGEYPFEIKETRHERE